MVVVFTFPLRKKLLGATGVHGGMMEGGSMASGCFLIRRHGLGGVDPRKRVAKGGRGVFVLRAAGGDHIHIRPGAHHAIIGPLLWKTSVEEAFRVGGG